MAGPGRHSKHARGRHSAQSASSAAARRTAPLAAFLAVLVVATGAVGALGLRDGGGRPTGLISDNRVPDNRADARPSTRPAPDDQASRDERPAPALGPMAEGTGPATPSTATAPSATASGPASRAPSRPASRAPTAGPTSPPAPPTSSAAAPPTSSAPAPPAGLTAEVTRLTNAERAGAGCAALRVDPRLTAAAQAHSEDMVDRDYFSHTSPDGEGPGDRATAAGYPSWSGENIAVGYPTPAAVVEGWMDSPGHRANILNCQSKATGVGYDARRNMWTQMFGFV